MRVPASHFNETLIAICLSGALSPFFILVGVIEVRLAKRCDKESNARDQDST